MRRRYAYDYTYLAPLAFIDKVPGLGFTLDWALLVLRQLVEVLINQVAVELDRDLSAIAADLEKLDRAYESGEHLKAGGILVGLLADLAKEKPSLGDLHASLRSLLGELRHLEAGALDVIKALCAHITGAEVDHVERFDSLADYEALFRTLPLPPSASTFETDASFAEMRVAGPNPLVLARYRAQAKFPVTEAMYQRVMGTGDSLAKAEAEGRLYAVDFALFDGALAGSYPEAQKYFAAPIALFAVPAAGPAPRRMVPVAIQCGQRPGPGNPIIQPPVDAKDAAGAAAWRYAKTVVQTADGNYHEAISHLGQTHLVVEPFVVATLNQLPDTHPIGRLLRPHFEGTLLINDLARKSLIAPGGAVDELLQGTVDQDRVVAAQGARMVLRDFDAHGLHAELAARGVDDPAALPHYPYRDAALAVHGAIAGWVEGYVRRYYPTEDAPGADAALQAWMRELRAHDGGRMAGIGEDGGVKTAGYLAEVLTEVIWRASGQHAAVNFPQKEIMSYPPAMPLGGYAPPPDGRPLSEEEWFLLLPPRKPAMTQVNVGTLLGGVYYTQLGQYEAGYFDDAAVEALLAQFQGALAALDAKFATAWPDYPFLRPSRIPQSINI